MASRREHRGRQKRPGRAKRHSRREAHIRVPEPEIVLPSRRFEPETVVAHVGPTNSGKTHSALQFLADRGRGVFAAPLRMLAQEAHRRLATQLGADAVGLVTGEERVNEHAPIICCTAEMAPLSGEVLVLDEVQWAEDAERGSAWTRLLLAGEYRHILLLGAVEALPLIENAFPEADVRFFERKAPLDWTGAVSFQSLKPGTVVVAFSRRAVLALAGELNRRQPGRVAVLYGAMPLASRRLEIERFMSGQAAVCCATDVLGHGVNLPCETLLFAESQKFDGEQRRDLHAWEIAQIAGRAGRFGLVERGHVGVLTGIVWANADPELIESALTPHVPLPGGHFGYRIVDTARIRPRLEDLPVESPLQLSAALRAWHTAALRQWAEDSWLSVESIGPLLTRLDAVQRRLRERGRKLPLEQVWKLVNAPVDEDNVELLATLALALAGDRTQRPILQWLLDTGRLREASLEDAEQAARTASILRWFALQYPDVGGVTLEKAAGLEEAASRRVSEKLAAEVGSPTVGRCKACGQSCAPWFALCERCYGRR
ncbi:MAG: ATP-dependent helicase [Gaiellaceae bacterium]|jgi:ATP-dependent RNA helicase SUPV3L1/SUV3|nr:ATP-dependent helicase [Gaiellaceae bacterium]